MRLNKKDYESSIMMLDREVRQIKERAAMEVDSELSSDSTNPVQNRAVFAAIQAIPKGEPGATGPQGEPGKVGTFEMDEDGALYYIEPE